MNVGKTDFSKKYKIKTKNKKKLILLPLENKLKLLNSEPGSMPWTKLSQEAQKHWVGLGWNKIKWDAIIQEKKKNLSPTTGEKEEIGGTMHWTSDFNKFIKVMQPEISEIMKNCSSNKKISCPETIKLIEEQFLMNAKKYGINSPKYKNASENVRERKYRRMTEKEQRDLAEKVNSDREEEEKDELRELLIQTQSREEREKRKESDLQLEKKKEMRKYYDELIQKQTTQNMSQEMIKETIDRAQDALALDETSFAFAAWTKEYDEILMTEGKIWSNLGQDGGYKRKTKRKTHKRKRSRKRKRKTKKHKRKTRKYKRKTKKRKNKKKKIEKKN
jgi:hypothetical protein